MQSEWRKNGERLPANPHATWITQLLRVVGCWEPRGGRGDGADAYGPAVRRSDGRPVGTDPPGVSKVWATSGGETDRYLMRGKSAES